MLQRCLATATESPGMLSSCPFFQEEREAALDRGGGWTTARRAGKAGGKVRSPRRDPRGPEETGDRDRAPWRWPPRMANISIYSALSLRPH